MAKFKDSSGREWSVNITVPLLPVLREAGFNVGLVTSDPKALAVLDDPEKLVEVLWILCDAQATAAAVSPEQFGASFDGPTLFAAQDAIMAAIVDFSQRPTVAAMVKTKLPGAMTRLEAAMVKQWEAALDKIGPTPSGSNDGPGNSPALPESLPTG